MPRRRKAPVHAARVPVFGGVAGPGIDYDDFPVHTTRLPVLPPCAGNRFHGTAWGRHVEYCRLPRDDMDKDELLPRYEVTHPEATATPSQDEVQVVVVHGGVPEPPVFPKREPDSTHAEAGNQTASQDAPATRCQRCDHPEDDARPGTPAHPAPPPGPGPETETAEPLLPTGAARHPSVTVVVVNAAHAGGTVDLRAPDEIRIACPRCPVAQGAPGGAATATPWPGPQVRRTGRQQPW